MLGFAVFALPNPLAIPSKPFVIRTSAKRIGNSFIFRTSLDRPDLRIPKDLPPPTSPATPLSSVLTSATGTAENKRLITPAESALTKNPLATPLESALPKNPEALSRSCLLSPCSPPPHFKYFLLPAPPDSKLSHGALHETTLPPLASHALPVVPCGVPYS
jgi:hypothetical protein